jgi:hypothetical protein
LLLEHAVRTKGLQLRLGYPDEVTEHELIIGAYARSRPDDVAGSFGEIKAGKAIGALHPGQGGF